MVQQTSTQQSSKSAEYNAGFKVGRAIGELLIWGFLAAVIVGAVLVIQKIKARKKQKNPQPS